MQQRKQDSSSTSPAWAPDWLPSGESLSYITQLATVAFLVLGTLYFLGVKPLAPFTRAHVAQV